MRDVFEKVIDLFGQPACVVSYVPDFIPAKLFVAIADGVAKSRSHHPILSFWDGSLGLTACPIFPGIWRTSVGYHSEFLALKSPNQRLR